MTLFRTDDPAPISVLRSLAEKAIALALRNKWAEAVEVNEKILESMPDDVDALNRLAKADLEIGMLDDAREALKRVISIAPNNIIARRNAERLARTEAEGAPQNAAAPSTTTFYLDIFMEEAGKSTTTTLVETGGSSVFQRLTGGEQVELVVDGPRLTVRSRRDDYLGRVPPRLAKRILLLMAGGNIYGAAVLHFGGEEVRVIIREVYQDASQAGKPSFPPPRPDGFRPYIRGRTLVYYDLEEPTPEAAEDGEEPEEVIVGEPERPKRGAFEGSVDDEDDSD